MSSLTTASQRDGSMVTWESDFDNEKCDWRALGSETSVVRRGAEVSVMMSTDPWMGSWVLLDPPRPLRT